MKLNTVNVIEYSDDNILGVVSFSDDDDGNKEAEAHFSSVIKENGNEVTDEEIETFIEEGFYEQGDYQAFLTHSN